MQKFRVEITETTVETAVVEILAESKDDAGEKALKVAESFTLDKEVTYSNVSAENITEIK